MHTQEYLHSHRTDGEYSTVRTPNDPCVSELCKPKGFVLLLGKKKALWLHFLVSVWRLHFLCADRGLGFLHHQKHLVSGGGNGLELDLVQVLHGGKRTSFTMLHQVL